MVFFPGFMGMICWDHDGIMNGIMNGILIEAYFSNSKTYWCVLRREFSGMIHFITSHVIISATPSNPSSNPTFGTSNLSSSLANVDDDSK